MQIGWIHDTGLGNEDRYPPGNKPIDAVEQDLRTLDRGYNSSLIVHGGDISFSDGDAVPHVTEPSSYESFWEVTRRVGVEDRIWAIPGNHETPVQAFLASHPHAVWRRQFRYPEMRAAVFLLNTAGPAAVTGSRGSFKPTAVGVNHGYVPQIDLFWLEEQLQDIPSHWTKIVFCHHHLYWSDNESIATYSPEPAHRSENFYEVVLNARRVHDLLSRHDRIVACQSHLWQSGTEGYTLADGVSYIYKSHYQIDDIYTTFGVLDIRPDWARVLTVDHDSREESVIFDSEEVDGW